MAPPSSPLAGVSLAGGIPTASALNARPAPTQQAVTAAVNKHLDAHPGCDYGSAFNAVYPQLCAGTSASAINVHDPKEF